MKPRRIPKVEPKCQETEKPSQKWGHPRRNRRDGA